MCHFSYKTSSSSQPNFALHNDIFVQIQQSTTLILTPRAVIRVQERQNPSKSVVEMSASLAPFTSERRKRSYVTGSGPSADRNGRHTYHDPPKQELRQRFNMTTYCILYYCCIIWTFRWRYAGACTGETFNT